MRGRLVCRMRPHRKQRRTHHQDGGAGSNLVSGFQIHLPTPSTGVAVSRCALNWLFNALATGRLWHATNSGSGVQRASRLNAAPMRFLSTLFWALVAAVVALFSWVNWNPVGLRLWDSLELDIQLPLLLLIVFLLGFLPTWLVMRTRVWSFRRRLEALDRQRVSAVSEPTTADEDAPVG